MEIYYAAAVRSMSINWHNFIFGAFDPDATITLDKLPGAFWIQALFIRAFGVHLWVIVLPQILEGVLSVLVLYRVVRRLLGAVAGIIAASILVLSPVNVALNRGNISDTLLILCLLLAVDAALSAATSGSIGSIVATGVWMGAAFQAKMLEAWLILPAIWLFIALLSTSRWKAVLARIAAISVVAAAVSLSWMSVVSLVPASSRPYVDGSSNNSVFHQVFVYNGFSRVGSLSPDQVLDKTVGTHLPPPAAPSWERLFRGSLGRAGGWLLPAAVLTLLAGLITTRRRARGDPWRASFVLWGAWLIVLGVTFSAGSSLNSYYLATLSPAAAGLLAAGAHLAWKHRESLVVRLLVLSIMTITVAYGMFLLPSKGEGIGPWTAPLVIFAFVVAATVVCISRRLSERSETRVGFIVMCSILMLPTIASLSIATNGLGIFDTPFELHSTAIAVGAYFGTPTSESVLENLEAARDGAPYLMATQSSAVAAPFIFETGLEVLPIGGFAGVGPSPTLGRLRNLIGEGKFHLVIEARNSRDSRIVWIAQNCTVVPAPSTNPSKLSIYYCQPGD
ncbi:MAG: glycosyltransferase family 39 protein [Acidimicrobiales bacterium]